MSYQKVTGSLMANSHPGSYCGQDAYNDVLVTEKKNELCDAENRRVQMLGPGIGTQDERLQRCNRFNFEGGQNMKSAVRRLTPLECERLQGFPDNWTLIGEPEEVEVKDYAIKYDEDGNIIEKTEIGTHKEVEYFWTDSNGKRKKCTDSARYKALGNSIAVGYANNQSGFWMWLMKRISATYERSATLGSLFDGIGGFPLAWEFYNGKGSCLWASEIEEFPIAVTKAHFPEGDEK